MKTCFWKPKSASQENVIRLTKFRKSKKKKIQHNIINPTKVRLI